MNDKEQSPRIEGEIETPDQDELSDEELDGTTGGGIIAPHSPIRAGTTYKTNPVFNQGNLRQNIINQNVGNINSH